MTKHSSAAILTHAGRRAVVETAERAGLLSGERSAIGARVCKALLKGAKARTGLASTTELLEYALAKVALEDDFAERLLALKGTVDPGLDLDF